MAYWVATSLPVLLMVKLGWAYLTQEAVRVECHRLGLPNYFRIELALPKEKVRWLRRARTALA